MKIGKTKISATIDNDILSVIEEHSVKNDISRSKQITRLCREALGLGKKTETNKRMQEILDKANKNESNKNETKNR